jgi:acetyltransferase-like isoleucine patch superfamily enzyme
MIDGNRLCNVLYLKISRIYTNLIRASFKGLGPGSIVHFPARIENPHRIVIGAGVTIGRDCWLNPVEEWQGENFDSQLIIGGNSAIMGGTQLSVVTRIEIGQRVLIGRGSVIVDHIHDYTAVDYPLDIAPLTRGRPVAIGDDVFLGVNCAVAPGVTIGRHSFVGANSVIINNIPSYCMVAGNPAVVMRRYNHGKRVWEKVRRGSKT